MTAFLALLLLASPGQVGDRTAVALERCLASPKGARPAPEPDADADSASGQDVAPEVPLDGRGICLDSALRSYDGRIVKAYRSLLKRSDPALAEWLSRTNAAWLDYRATATDDADRVTIARDHALWLEGLRR